jgi:hypothetical protein
MSVAPVDGLVKKVLAFGAVPIAWRWVAFASVLNFEIWGLTAETRRTPRKAALPQ